MSYQAYFASVWTFNHFVLPVR